MEIASWKRGKAEQHMASLCPAVATFEHGKVAVMSTPRCAGDLLWTLRNTPLSRRMISQAATWIVNPSHTKASLTQTFGDESFQNEFESSFEEDDSTEQVTLRLKITTINRIKKSARQVAYERDQDVTYTDVIRDILEREFPPQ
jgi:predicted DNA binding CopG/RHH family protein